MRTLILIAILCIAIGNVSAQDYSNMIVRVEATNTYVRFDHEPVILCVTDTISEEWNTALQDAISQISQFVTLSLGSENCDITLAVVTSLVGLCQHNAWGCTDITYRQSGDHLAMISEVRILSSRPERVFLLLHEILHALGIVGHSSDRNNIMYPIANPNIKELSAEDGAMLEYLYTQPAFR